MFELSQTVFTNWQWWLTADHNFQFSIFNLKVTLGQICFAYRKLSSRTGNGGSPPAVLKIYFNKIVWLVGNAYA